MQGSGPYPPAAYGQPVARGGQPSTSAAAAQPSSEEAITDKVINVDVFSFKREQPVQRYFE